MKAKTKTKRNKPKRKLSIKIDTRLLLLLFLPLFSFMETGSGQWITKKSQNHDSYVPAHLDRSYEWFAVVFDWIRHEISLDQLQSAILWEIFLWKRDDQFTLL